MMNILLDNIIFSLQKTGGISVVWQQHLQHLEHDESWQATYLEYANQNIHRAQIQLQNTVLLPYRRMERYRTPDWSQAEGKIFHSSYFRILPGAKNVTTVHDLTYHYYRRGLAKAVHLWEEQRALRASEHVICISENTKRDLLRHYTWLDENKVSVVYNGVSDIYAPTICPNVTAYQDKEYLLYVGNRMVHYKRFEYAVAIAAQVKMPLVFVGHNVQDEETRHLNEQLGEGRWQAIEHATEETINCLYNHAQALIYPSDYEGFGLPLIEAQRAGCPVIAQAASCIPEIAGKGAWLVETDSHVVENMSEAVQQLTKHEDIRCQLIKEGLTNAQRFSWDKTYKETTDIYKRLQ